MLGDEIRNARLEAKMTQEALSYAAQIDRSYLSMLENNKKSPTVDVLVRICESMGVTASALLARVEQAKERAKRK